MTDHPIENCMNSATPIVRAGNAIVFQKFTCASCGVRQTMGEPNKFYTHGQCEECGHITDIQKSGCNYILHQAGTPQGVAQLREMYGEVSTELTFVDCNNFMKNSHGNTH